MGLYKKRNLSKLDILEIAEIIGIVSFALSGFFIASWNKLDILGVFIASFLTALGGGVMRDVLTGRELFAFHNNSASILVILVVVLGVVFKLHRFEKIEKSPFFIIADTLGLVSFALSGALVATEAGFNFFGVILLAFITAVGGGVMRDVLINKIPIILVSEFYGSVAFLIGIFIYVLFLCEQLNYITIVLVFIIGIVIRLLAYYQKWHLPKIM